jgi:hypothetical protein
MYKKKFLNNLNYFLNKMKINFKKSTIILIFMIDKLKKFNYKCLKLIINI